MNILSNRSSSSPTTRKHIACSQVRAGMFLVKILDSWWKSPFFVHHRLLRHQDVAQLLQSGIQEVEIDTSKGLDVSPDSGQLPLDDMPEGGDRTETPNHQNGSCSEELQPCSHDGNNVLEEITQEQLVRLRGDAITALENVFEGVKTGQAIPRSTLHATAQAFIQKALGNPTILAEIMLIDHLEQFDKSLYTHVVDTAVLSILVGLQLGWDVKLLEEVAVAALLHDVGYMRLPLNLVQTRWGRTGIDSSLLQQHVDIGCSLIHKKSQFSPEIVQMVREHHAYPDGSGFSQGLDGIPLSDSGKLLGLVDYFDELLAAGNTPGSIPAALAIRRMYQEAQKGKFPTLFIEAMIRVFGVFPVGSLVKLSTGEDAVVVRQNPEISVKPYVKIIRARNGQILDNPEEKNLALDADLGHEVSIIRVLDSPDPSIHLRDYFF